MKGKKLICMSLGALAIATGQGYTSVSANNSITQDSYVSAIEENDTNYDFREQKFNEFKDIFPDEMEILENVVSMNKYNLARKSENTLIEEAKEMGPMIEAQKTIGDELYKLTIYPNGVFIQSGIYGGEVEEITENSVESRATTGITGGTTQSGTGYSNGYDRIAYCNFYSNSLMNTTQGHTIQATISYSIVKGAYDSLTAYKLGPSLMGTTNAYTYATKSKENASGGAYVKYRFNGRTSWSSTGSIYNTFEFRITVGNDQVMVEEILL